MNDTEYEELAFRLYWAKGHPLPDTLGGRLRMVQQWTRRTLKTLVETYVTPDFPEENYNTVRERFAKSDYAVLERRANSILI